MTIRVPIDGEMGFENRSGRISYWFSFRSMSLEHFSLALWFYILAFVMGNGHVVGAHDDVVR